ncbi:MAG: D-Ala-D-Ala carboxypeptidase family metallohydrolase [Pseudomonadota bacterium]
MSQSSVPQDLKRFIAPGVEVLYFSHHAWVTKAEWPWKNFTPQEMACKGTGSVLLVPSFMDRLQALRTAFKAPLKVNSGFRSPSHDRAVGGAETHPTGRAVDLAVFGDDALRLIGLAATEGFTGFGVKQHGGMERRFIHLDDLQHTETRGPRPWLWTYD